MVSNMNYLNFLSDMQEQYKKTPTTLVKNKNYFESFKEIEEMTNNLNNNYSKQDLHKLMNKAIKANNNISFETFLTSIEKSKIDKKVKEHFAKLGASIYSKPKMTFIEDIIEDGIFKNRKKL